MSLQQNVEPACMFVSQMSIVQDVATVALKTTVSVMTAIEDDINHGDHTGISGMAMTCSTARVA